MSKIIKLLILLCIAYFIVPQGSGIKSPSEDMANKVSSSLALPNISGVSSSQKASLEKEFRGLSKNMRSSVDEVTGVTFIFNKNQEKPRKTEASFYVYLTQLREFTLSHLYLDFITESVSGINPQKMIINIDGQALVINDLYRYKISRDRFENNGLRGIIDSFLTKIYTKESVEIPADYYLDILQAIASSKKTVIRIIGFNGSKDAQLTKQQILNIKQIVRLFEILDLSQQ